MCTYNNRQIIIFGGGTKYLDSIKMRLCISELYIYDINTKKWTNVPEVNEVTPERRMYHVAATMGCLMLVHGGINSVKRVVLGDFHLFDLELKEWIECAISPKMVKKGA